MQSSVVKIKEETIDSDDNNISGTEEKNCHKPKLLNEPQKIVQENHPLATTRRISVSSSSTS